MNSLRDSHLRMYREGRTGWDAPDYLDEPDDDAHGQTVTEVDYDGRPEERY